MVRSEGLARLQEFLPRAGHHYAERRNLDLGPDDRDNVSGLSPWLRHRLLLESEVVGAAVGVHGPKEAESFVQEVVWRSYFKGYLENRPGIWRRYLHQLESELHRVESEPDLGRRVQRATGGDTGIECFDAWTRELLDTGYLHNHARMWYASIWIYTLGLPWQIGADFFLRHLLDGDPASNTLSWRWVCGLHTVGKTYLARAANIDKYTGGRFPEPRGLAESAPSLQEEPVPAESTPATDEPPRDPGFALLVTEEDCDPSSLGLAAPPGVVVGCDLDAGWSPLGRSAAAAGFARGAIDDAVERAATKWRVPAVRLSSAGELQDWVRKEAVRTLVVAWMPVGPIADALGPGLELLAREGAGVKRIRRDWDELTWPAATHGFFRMRKIIPDLLERFA